MPKKASWKDDDIYMLDTESAGADNLPRDDKRHRERIWLWCAVKCYDTKVRFHGFDIKSMVEWLGSGRKLVYIHNLKWDGQFLISYLLHMEGKPIWGKTVAKHLSPIETVKNPGEWTTFIDDRKKSHYYYTLGVRKGVCEIRDSYKIIPESVRELGKASGNLKEHLEDYDRPRPEGYIPTAHEIEYCEYDCLAVIPHIVGLREMGLDKLTAGSNAMKWLTKEAFGQGLKNDNLAIERFHRAFPMLTPTEWSFDQKAYTGGLCFVNPRYKAREVHNIISLDANSLYPSRMALKPMPYGKSQHFFGKPMKASEHLLWIARIKCCFVVRKHRFPFLHNGWATLSAQFLTHSGFSDSDISPMELTLTSVDFETMLRQYEVWDIQFIEGYYYKATTRYFGDPIKKLYAYKQEASKNASECKRKGDMQGYYKWNVKKQNIKRVLNNIYGKFGQSFNQFIGNPVLHDDEVSYEDVKTQEEPKDNEEALTYIPVAAFTTAYGRQWLLEQIEKVHDRFVYCDTDSLHVITDKDFYKDYGGIPIDQYKLGYFKNETPDALIGKNCGDSYPIGIYLHPKAYAHFYPNGDQIDLTCGGLSYEARKNIRRPDWHFGAIIPNGKTRPVLTEGGVYLASSDYNIVDIGAASNKTRNQNTRSTL